MTSALLLRKRLRAAIPESVAQKEAFDLFSEKQSAHVPEWRKMVLAWELDQSKPNPYEIPKSGASCQFFLETLTQSVNFKVKAKPKFV